MRYVLYDKNSGAILHTHQSFKLGSDEPQDMAEDEMRLIISRFAEVEKLDIAKTAQPLQSSRQADMSVDVKTGEVVVKPLLSDALSRRLAELHAKTAKEED